MNLEVRRTKSNKVAVFGPLSVIRQGMTVTVEVDGKPHKLTVTGLGKPFQVQGAWMVYGYVNEDGWSSTRHIGTSIQGLVDSW